MFSRREVLKGFAVAGVSSLSPARASRRTLRGNRVRIGVMGCGDRGRTHARLLAERHDVRVTLVCDSDIRRGKQTAAEVERICGRRPAVRQQMWQAAEDPAVDAVLLAVPDQCLSAAMIRAGEAGHHVSVATPVLRGLRQAQLLIDTAQANGCVVQAGNLLRTDHSFCHAVRLLREGVIGDVVAARAWVGRRERHLTDLDLVDLARWGLGVDGQHSESVVARCGNLHCHQPRHAANIRSTIWDFAPSGGDALRRQLIIERTDEPPRDADGHPTGSAFSGTSGRLVLSRTGHFRLIDADNRQIEEWHSHATQRERIQSHHADFLDSIRHNRQPLADIEPAVRSATDCRLGTIAAHLRRKLFLDSTTGEISGDSEATALLA